MEPFLLAFYALWAAAHVAAAVRAGRVRAAYHAGLDALPALPASPARRWNDRLAAAAELWAAASGGAVLLAFVAVPLSAGLLPGAGSPQWWATQALRYVLAVLLAGLAFDVWRATRDRWPVAAFGPPRLRTRFGEELKRRGPAPPMLAAPVPPAPPDPPPDGYDQAGAVIVRGAVAALVLFLLVSGLLGGMGREVNTWLIAAVGALWLTDRGLRRWWGPPERGEAWFTEVGAVTDGRRAAWEAADRVAVAPIPADLGGGAAVEVAAADRTARFLVAPDAVGKLDDLLAAVPPGRLVRADGDGPAVAPPGGGLPDLSPFPAPPAR